ncbi:MAG: hypothetical protein ACQEVT_12820 [Pseudomonadota bacterium]|uniref:hypothetical protein n=1 Tax=Roseovarius TaxID=74030 RepID=UPI0022A81F67|nr:hypothetical protein [Roseovarius sp. EGI FJ00037]MCZ0812132.1 hypothetical protein [Roseovarius sp. EGI FJ00037]
MFSDQTWLARLIWAALVCVVLWAVFEWQLELAFVALATLALSMAPVYVAKWADIRVPPSFIAALGIFVAGTLFLGEVFDFYGRLWWWDMAMHASSAIGFGLIGFLLVFMMFQGDRYAAPPIAVAFFAFCFGMTIGTLWEIFEFGMDQLFGFNMQKSGLLDTMSDLIVNMIGAVIGAASGFAYLKGQARGGLTGVIDEFVQRNPRFFKRWTK